MTSALRVPLTRSTAARVLAALDRVRANGLVVLRRDPRAAEPRLGWPSSASRTAPGSMPRSGSPSCARGVSPGAGACRRRVGGAASWICSGTSIASARAGIRAISVAAVDDDHVAIRRDLADDRAAQAPARHDLDDVVEPARASTIASIRSCDSLIITSNGSMSCSRSGTARRSRRMPVPPRAATSDVAHVRPAAPRSCMPSTRPVLDELQRRLDQQLARERIADLDARAHGGRAIVERRAREHGRTTDAVAPGRRAEQHGHRAGRRRDRARDIPSARTDADAHHVDQRVARVGRVEGQLAAHGRYPDAVAVAADAAHDAVDESPRAPIVGPAELERVEQRDWPRAHGDDVAQDAADAGRGALVWLDRARVVVRLDLEGDGQPIADAHDARVLARAGEHIAAGGGQRAQERASSSCTSSARSTSR